MPFPTLVAFLLAVRRCSPAVSNISSSLVSLSGLRKDMEVIDQILSSTATDMCGDGHVSSVDNITECRRMAEQIGICLAGRFFV
jgi:hypothetical protein